MSAQGAQRDKTLILCIDNDNDIGTKASVQTPVIGKEANVEAATRLLLQDPEEADANAIFAAVKMLNTLQGNDSQAMYEVATVCGSEKGGVEADRKIISELNQVLDRFPARGVIFVSDGYSDQEIIPIIQSRVPIVSLRHVVVKHSERLEETWAVLLRYAKMIANDPRYSRFSLGVPGIILLVVGALWIFNQLQTAGIALLFILGAAFCIKGFGLDDKIEDLKPTTLEDQLKLTTRVTGFVLIVIGSYLGAAYAATLVPSGAHHIWEDPWYWFGLIPSLIGYFLWRGVDLIIIGTTVSFVGEGVFNFMKHDTKFWRSIVGVFIAVWLRFILVESANILLEPNRTVTLNSPIVVMTIGSLATTATLILLISRMNKRVYAYFEKSNRVDEKPTTKN